jgi:hypothetical protein
MSVLIWGAVLLVLFVLSMRLGLWLAVRKLNYLETFNINAVKYLDESSSETVTLPDTFSGTGITPGGSSWYGEAEVVGAQRVSYRRGRNKWHKKKK